MHRYKSSQPRSIRLERLECRTLLAGGIDDVLAGVPDLQHRGHHDNRLPIEARHSEVRHTGRSSDAGESAPDRGDRRHGRQRDDRPEPSRDQAPPRPEPPPQIIPPNSNGSSAPSPLNLLSSSELALEQPSRQIPDIRVDPSAASAPTAANNDAAIRSLLLTDDDAVTPRSIRDETVIDTESFVRAVAEQAERASTIDSATGESSDASIQQNDVVETSSSDHVQSDHQQTYGYIDFAERGEGGERSVSDATAKLSPSNGFESWRLDDDTVPKLQHRFNDDPVVDLFLRDQTPQRLLGDTTGMIALHDVVLPSHTLPLGLTPIDVKLESTLMLARPWQWLATEHSPAISGPLLATILASLDEAASSPIQPVHQASVINLSHSFLVRASIAVGLLVVAFPHRLGNHRRSIHRKARSATKPTHANQDMRADESICLRYPASDHQSRWFVGVWHRLAGIFRHAWCRAQ